MRMKSSKKVIVGWDMGSCGIRRPLPHVPLTGKRERAAAYFVRLYQNKEVIDHEPSMNKLLSETRYNPDSVRP